MTKSVPSLQRPQEPRADRYVNSCEDMAGGRPTIRFDGEVEDVECVNIDEVPGLFETVPDESGTRTDKMAPTSLGSTRTG